MGMAVGGTKRGTFAEINIVPLIDVLLVLLVIFMIIPHQQTGLQVEIPQPAPFRPAPIPDVVVVEVLADGSLRVNQQPVKWGDLRERLEDIFRRRNNHTAFVRGDSALEFHVVARVIDVMHTSGALAVGLMTPEMDRMAPAD